ncbi:hypothetical protein AMK19_32845 [Kitasatospora sp. CB01950]|nr:hypothetical protein AMK19_32845 [Kitasatospora sp. CB01950]
MGRGAVVGRGGLQREFADAELGGTASGDEVTAGAHVSVPVLGGDAARGGPWISAAPPAPAWSGGALIAPQKSIYVFGGQCMGGRANLTADSRMVFMTGEKALSIPYDCVVCLKPIEVAPDGTIRIEGIVKQEKQWLWGPYPVHEPCRLDIRTIYDQLLGDGVHSAIGYRTKADDPETTQMLSTWAQAFPGSVAHEWPGDWSRHVPPLETPWPEFTHLIDLNHKHLAGLVAKRGSREATAGTAIAVHAAATGKRVLLFTGYPPQLTRPTLVIDETHSPTPDVVDQAMKSAQPDLVVIERWERMHADRPVGGSRADVLESIGHDLKRTVLDHEIPCLVTTSIPGDVEVQRPLPHWIDLDSPVAIMIEFCNPLLLLKRHTPAEVLVHVERHMSMQDRTVHAVAWRS